MKKYIGIFVSLVFVANFSLQGMESKGLIKYAAQKRYASNNHKKTSFLNAVRTGNQKEVKRLLNEGVSPDTNNVHEWPALVIAANNGQGNIVDILLAHGADVNKTTKKGKTALMIAVMTNRPIIVQKLINAGAQLDTYASGMTPLMIAVNNRNPRLVQMLLNAGAHPLLENMAGETAMDYSRSPAISRMLENAAKHMESE